MEKMHARVIAILFLSQVRNPLHRAPRVPHPKPVQRLRFVICQAPVGKPRMTRRDRWKVRPEVERYRDFADAARLAAGARHHREKLGFPVIAVFVRAYFEMPKSWSKKRRREMAGEIHRVKPDGDNCMKSVKDALLERDEQVGMEATIKRWCREGEAPRTEVVLWVG
jgi:Holliday junction resolvase RusA-like endonuclease